MAQQLPEPLVQIQKALSVSIHGLEIEKESQKYEAKRFSMGTSKVVYRVSQITPTKSGQFVTLWQRSAPGPIIPFHTTDLLDLVIIFSQRAEKTGFFIFPKEVLVKRGIIATDTKKGKLGFRIYPPWAIIESAQARKTQSWQVPYFLALQPQEPKPSEKLLALLGDLPLSPTT